MQGSPPAPFAHPYGQPPVFNTPGQQYPVPGGPGAAPYGAPQGFPQNAPGFPGQFPGGPVPPYGAGSPTNLPPRPAPIPGAGAQAPNAAIAASVDQLISEATGQKAPEAAVEKPAKEKKNVKLVYSGGEQNQSPEEMMAALPKYVF